MAKWLDKYEQGGLVLKKKTKDNYGKRENPNDIKASVGPDFVGLGYNTKGRDYSPAWGGQFQDGGEIHQAQNGWLEKLTSTLNPYNWRVEDYSKEKDFTKAYSTAKKAGEEEFMYKGKRYNTKYAGTPRQEVGTYGVDGKPVHPMDLNHPAQVNLYPAFGKYLPGHISASVGDNETSIDYSSRGNFPFGINEVKNKGEKSFNVYGQDNLTFSNKAASLPTGDYMLEDKYTPSDWNLFINNCADNVCDAFGIPRSKGIQTPSGAVSKIKKKYPTLDITGKAYEDYYDLSEKLQSSFPEKILPQAKNILGIASSPDLKKLKPKFISSIQQALYESGYELPKSKLKNNNNFDGVLGDETKAALLDWQKKNKSLAMGGALPGAVGFTYARVAGSAPANGKYTKKTKASAQNGKEMSFYQNGLDFKPKSISKNGSIIKDDRGQWAYPGEVTEIGSNDITMQGVDYPVLGISDTGDTKMMYPDQDYKFDGNKVTEFPMAQDGGWLDKYQDGGNINKKLKEEAEERLTRMNRPKATISQYTPKPGEQAKFDKQKLERIAEDNAPLNRMAASKGAKNIQDAIEAAMIIEGGLAASKLIGKGAKAAAKQTGRIYNTVATGESALPIAWKSPAKGLSQEASDSMFKGIANTNKLSDADRALLLEYQYDSKPFTGRWGKIDQSKRQALNDIIQKNKLNIDNNAILTRKFSPNNKSLGAEFINGRLNLGDRPSSFSAGIGVPSYGSGAVDRLVVPNRYTKQMGNNLLANEYGIPSDKTFDLISGSVKDFAAARGVMADDLINAEREVIGTGLDFKRIGKVKNDIGGYDHVVKPSKKETGGWLNKYK